MTTPPTPAKAPQASKPGKPDRAAMIVAYVLEVAVAVLATVHLTSTEGWRWAWVAIGLVSWLAPTLLSSSTWAPCLSAMGAYVTVWLAGPEELLESMVTGWAIFMLASLAATWVLRLAQRLVQHRKARDAQGAKLISFSGLAGAGKDTAAHALVAEGWVRMAFADRLKAVAYDTNPWVRPNDGHMVRLRLLVDNLGWDEAKEHTEVREYLQRLGVAARDHIDDDVWVTPVMAALPADECVVITDARFPNELAAVQAHGGITAVIERPGLAAVNSHVSETAWASHSFDAKIHNTGTAARLHATALYLASRTPTRRRKGRARP